MDNQENITNQGSQQPLNSNPPQPLGPQPLGQQPPPQHMNNSKQPPIPPQNSDTDVLGIVSIILAFVGVQLIGLIVGIIGMSKAKKEGRSITLSRIGVILNIVFMILIVLLIVPLVLITFRSTELIAQDSIGKSNVSSVYGQLEVYYNDNGNYPQSLSELQPSAGLDPEVIDAFTTDPDYRYTPVGCDEVGCDSFSIAYKLQEPDNFGQSEYTKESLNSQRSNPLN